MTLMAKRFTWKDLNTLLPNLNFGIDDIVNQWNNHDQALSKWQKISTSGTLNVDGTTTFNTATYSWPGSLPGSTSILQSTSAGVLSWTAASTAYAPLGSKYVILGTDATLTAYRTLTGTTNQIIVTDNGATSTVVLSTPQNINTGANPTFAGLTLSGLIANSFLYSGAGGLLSTTTAPTNGQLLIGSTGVAPVAATLTGTTNQVNVANAAGSITLSTPQNINTGASPTFSGLTLSGLTANSFLYSGTGGLLTTTIAPTNGQILIGSTGVAPVSTTITGTTNQISVTNGAGSITLATPQNINTGASPTFSGLTLSGLTANSFLYSGTAGLLTTTAAPTNGQLLIGSTSAAPVSAVLTGTANQITVTNGAGSITLSTPQNIDTGATPTFSSLTLTATSNQLVLGTTRTVTVTAPTPATASRTWTIPDISGNGTIAALEGTQTFSGAKTFSSTSGTTNSAASNTKLTLQTINNTDNTNSSSQTRQLIKAGGTSAGAAYTEYSDGTQSYCIGIDTPVSEQFTIATGTALSGGSATFQNIICNKTTGATLINGTNTNDSASAGYVGELIESQISSSTNTGASAVAFNATSISLTSGDWDVSSIIDYTRNGATFTSVIVYTAISTTSGNAFTGEVIGSNAAELGLGGVATSFTHLSLTVPQFRVSLSTTTTYYLKGYIDTFTAGQPQYICRISARRRR